MGLTHAIINVKRDHAHTGSVDVKFLIDSGAVYSVVPLATLKKLGIKPYRLMQFIFADGTQISRNVSDAYFEWRGEAKDEPLLGSTALESLGLVLDPFKRELYPMRMLMV
jgi:predicted aspartyl protease